MSNLEHPPLAVKRLAEEWEGMREYFGWQARGIQQHTPHFMS